MPAPGDRIRFRVGGRPGKPALRRVRAVRESGLICVLYGGLNDYEVHPNDVIEVVRCG